MRVISGIYIVLLQTPLYCGFWDMKYRRMLSRLEYVDISLRSVCLSVCRGCNLQRLYLPPANEVWGQVIFSEPCVKNSVQWGVPGQVHPPGPGTPPRPGTPPGAVHAGRYGQKVGGAHPTGMQSC